MLILKKEKVNNYNKMQRAFFKQKNKNKNSKLNSQNKQMFEKVKINKTIRIKNRKSASHELLNRQFCLEH